jgi:RNA polymerase sigma-70 factor (ECF subfamily)
MTSVAARAGHGVEDRRTAAAPDGLDGLGRLDGLGSLGDHVNLGNLDDPDGLDRAAARFVALRPRLHAVARRILPDPAAAEDVVQDAWLRWQKVDRASVVNANAFLVTTTTRLALNDAQSARRRHEAPAGGGGDSASPELAPGPEAQAERDEAVERALLILLARLTAAERAALVLRAVFDYPYEQIAARLQVGVPGCRQLVHRAREHLVSRHDRPVSVTAHRRMVEAFVAAARDGRVRELADLLARDVVRG